MASEEFISLGSLCEVDAKYEEGTSLHTMSSNVKVNPLVIEHQLEGQPSTVDSTKASDGVINHEGQDRAEGEPSTMDNTRASDGIIDLEGQAQVDVEPSTVDNTKVSDVIIDLEEGQVEDMDLSDDDIVVVKHQHLDASIQSRTSVAAVQNMHGVSVELDQVNGPESGQSHASKGIFIDESPMKGVKRARVESIEPSVRVIYSNLTRESRRKLMELMQQWSEWQTGKQHMLTKAAGEVLECGEETYYPALHVGSEKSCAVSFWVDNQAKESVAVDDDSVPLYDREFTLGSTPLGDPSNNRADKDDSRCFNCGSYSHAMKECPKPRDNVAINNARKQHNMKRNQSNVNRGQNRYYQKTPGKFDDLRAGVLGPETRECLGIRENDPPPWLHRMRELGYPPGYLDVVDDEDKPSGITIFGDGEIKQEYEEGELPEQGEPSPPRIRKAVEFPGINGPIPENGDRWLWDSTPPQYSGRHHSSDSREQHDRGPPGADHGSSRYHSYDYGPASPSIGRSHSDRGWRSSSSYENLPADDGARTPHAHSSRQYSSQYSTSLEMSSRHSRDRHDRHYHHRR
ncbi:hypothetical protein ABZP36_021329 [Zizania latifolia]